MALPPVIFDLEVLEPMERTDRVLYLLAILYSRQGDDRKAVESYLKACRLNPSFVHRGNLDPEIASLIRKYGLDHELQENENNLTFIP